MNISGVAQFARAAYSPNQPMIMANKNLVYPVPDEDWQTKGLMVNICSLASGITASSLKNSRTLLSSRVFICFSKLLSQQHHDIAHIDGKVDSTLNARDASNANDQCREEQHNSRRYNHPYIERRDATHSQWRDRATHAQD